MMNLFGHTGSEQGGGEPTTLWKHFMAAVTNYGNNPAYTGQFANVTSFPGALIGSPTNLVSFPKGTGLATTTTLPRASLATGPAVTTPSYTGTTTPSVSRGTTTVPLGTTTIKPTTSTTKPTKTTSPTTVKP
jgi:hypothetical protein